MNDVPILLALTAGMVAALNPCGFALLPAYLTLVVAGGDEGSSRSAAVGRALTMSASMTAGFVAVFGAFGLVAVPLALSLERYLPWATIVIGFALVGLGVYLLTGRELLINTPKMAGAAPGKTVRSMFLYGVAYAVASLSCTIGPFLAVTGSALRSGSAADGVLVYAAYAAGIALVVAVLAVSVALASGAVIDRMRRILPYINRISGAVLLVVGLYVAYYGWFELRLFSGAGGADDPVIAAAGRVQRVLAGWVYQGGVWPWLLMLATLLSGAAATLTWRRRRVSR